MRRALYLFLFVLCVSGACGGSVTLVDGNKNVATLNPIDESQFCHDTFSYIQMNFNSSDLAKIQCGAYMGTTSADCQGAYNACVQKSGFTNQPIVMTPTQAQCDQLKAQLGQCNITVGQYSTCLKQLVDALKAYESHFPICDQNAEIQAAYDVSGKLSQECVKLFLNCGTFAPSMGGGTTPDAGPPDANPSDAGPPNG